MDCRTFHKRLEDYLQDGLDFPGRFGVERHARQCYACDRDLAAALKLRRLARNLGRVSAPADFEVSVMARIQREKSRHGVHLLRRFRIYGFEAFSWRGLAYGAGSLALLAMSFFLLTVWIPTGSVPVDTVTNGAAPAAVPDGPDGASPPVESMLSGPDATSATRPMGEEAPRPLDLSGGGYSAGGLGSAFQMAPADSEYVEYLVPGAGDRQLIMRLPRTILMKYGQPSEEYFIRNVSH